MLLKDDTVDVFLIVGGWDSSNTAHLLEIVDMQGKTGYPTPLPKGAAE